MRHYVTSSKSSAYLYQARSDKAHGHPTPPAGYIGCSKDSLPPGRGDTLHEHDVTEHPDGKQWAHPIVDPTGKPGKLTPLERAYLAGKLNDGEDLNATWRPSEPKPGPEPKPIEKIALDNPNR